MKPPNLKSKFDSTHCVTNLKGMENISLLRIIRKLMNPKTFHTKCWFTKKSIRLLFIK